MAYIGTTSASSVANPPRSVQPLDAGRIASTGSPIAARLWMYCSTGTSTDPFTAGFFSDGYTLGMKQGDVVIHVNQTSTVSSSQVLALGVVSSVSSTGGGTQLSTFSFISST
jgi:hypothetical protein